MSQMLMKFERVAEVRHDAERFDAMLKFLKKLASALFARITKVRRRAMAAHRRTLKLTKGRDTTLPPIG